MRCLDEGALAVLFSTSSGERRVMPTSELDVHLDTCSTCRSLVAAYAIARDDAVLPSTSPNEPTDPTVAAGACVGGRYELDSVLGEGGMGTVWSALDRSTQERVAVKVLTNVSPVLVKRFAREARLMALIGHPNVVEVRAVFSLSDGTPAFVMDLVEGPSLAAELRLRGGRLSVADVIELFVPLVSAVRAAHAEGIVHRDLKPQNVMLATGDGGPPLPMLVDFGLAMMIAKDADALTKLTQTGMLVGTPKYMAPEQLYGDPTVDARADVWALGAIAFECLTGRLPLEGKSLAQLVRSATGGALANLPASVPAPLAETVMGMLAIERAERLSVAEVHARFDRWRVEGI